MVIFLSLRGAPATWQSDEVVARAQPVAIFSFVIARVSRSPERSEGETTKQSQAPVNERLLRHCVPRNDKTGGHCEEAQADEAIRRSRFLSLREVERRSNLSLSPSNPSPASLWYKLIQHRYDLPRKSLKSRLRIFQFFIRINGCNQPD
jgi:hypothetical protein